MYIEAKNQKIATKGSKEKLWRNQETDRHRVPKTDR